MFGTKRVIRAFLTAVGITAIPWLASAQEPAFSGNVAVNGVSLHYRIYGEGDPLLLVHGFTHAGQVWEPLVSELSRQNSLIVPDMRGHGLSTNPSKEFTHRLAARDILELLDSLRIPSVVGVGHSSGGRAAEGVAQLICHQLKTNEDGPESLN